MDDGDAEHELSERLGIAARLNASIGAAQALTMRAVHDAVRSARRHPEVYVPVGGCRSRAEAIRFAERSVVLDLALRLRLPEGTIWSQYHDAELLIEGMPRLWSAFRAGLVAGANIRTATMVARSLPDEPRILADLDAALEKKASALTPSKFRSAARAIRERLHPDDSVERNIAARRRRRVEIEPADDGMAWFHLFTDAPTVMKIDSRLEAAALRQRQETGEERTMAQLRADAAGDVLTGAGTAAEVRTHVHVSVPVTALLDTPDVLSRARLSPAVLDGYGPIDDATAARMVADSASFRRVFTDPISGVDLNLDRRSYRPTAAQREWIRRKYATCVTPTCSRRSIHSDIDHTVDWQFDGLTDGDNLAPLSRGHHTLKHKTKNRLERKADGRYTWVTPTGFASDNDPPPF